MKIFLVSIFPDIFSSFLNTSLIKKSIDKEILAFELINPRDFCITKNQQIDDEIYGGGVGLLIRAKPVIDAVNFAIEKIDGTFKILYLSPSKKIFNQAAAHEFAEYKNLIIVCGRYEGIDFRFDEYFSTNYPNNFEKISLGKFVLLGGEVAAMTTIEAIVRLVPGVIKEEMSWIDESYSVSQNMQNLEYPQYTRPADVYGMGVPQVLLSGNHKKIEKRRFDKQSKNVSQKLTKTKKTIK